MLQVIYYIIITIFALLFLLEIVKKRPFTELVCIAFVLVTFTLRALHINNKKVVRELGFDVDIDKDIVFVDGKKVVRATHFDYVMFYKPKGCVTTLDDSKDNKSGRPKSDIEAPLTSKKPSDDIQEVEKKRPRKTVLDYIGGDFKNKRLFPVGRLDYDSEGLLLLTNDGDLTYKLTHPSSEIPKTYIVAYPPTPIATSGLNSLTSFLALHKLETTLKGTLRSFIMFLRLSCLCRPTIGRPTIL